LSPPPDFVPSPKMHQNAFQPAEQRGDAEQRVSVLNGYLFKMKRNQGRFSLSAWSKRWFSIEGDKLLWYSNKGSQQPSSYISLTSIAKIKEFETGRDGVFSFQVKSSERNLFLRTKSQGDLDRWTRALKMHRDLWVKKMKETRPKLKKTTSQLDSRLLEVERLSAECDALARKVIDEENKNKSDNDHRMSTTSSQSSSRRNSFNSTSSSSSSLGEHRPANTNRQETKPPNNRDRESPRENVGRDSPPDCARGRRESPPPDVHETQRDSLRESTRTSNYRSSPRASWNEFEYEPNQSPGRLSSRESNTYHENHSGGSRSPLNDDYLYENVGNRYNSRNSGYSHHQSGSPPKPKKRPGAVDTRDEDCSHNLGTPVSKCWDETTVADSKPVSHRNQTKFSKPEVEDSAFEDCRDPTFEQPKYSRPGLTSMTTTNWVDEMWDSDEE
jgi:hypothetical protein